MTDAPTQGQRWTTHVQNGREDRHRFYRPDRMMRTPKGKGLVERLRMSLEAHEVQVSPRVRKRRQADQESFERAVEAILCDLIHAELSEDYRSLAIDRSHRKLCSTSRYRPWYYGKQLPDVLDLMEGTELLTQVKGKWKPDKKGHLTLIQAGDMLIEDLAVSGLTLADLGYTYERETIRLRGMDKEWVEYRDTNRTALWREEMQEINEYLAQADITFDPSIEYKDRVIDPYDRRLYRIFIRSSFLLHGRLHGGFWIGLPKALRLKGIRIDGHRVVGLDYGQSHPRIAYALVGHDPPTGDLYAIPGLETYRDGIKELTNAMFNHAGYFKHEPEDLKHPLPPELSIRQVQDRILQHHAPIADLLLSDVGQDLSLIESEVMVGILLRLKALGVVALPIHDCIVVREDHAEVATQIMTEVFEEYVGVTPIINPEAMHELNEDDEDEVTLRSYLEDGLGYEYENTSG